jgi:hypothetical protein
MTEVIALWLPILVSAVLVFVASSIIHMAPLWTATSCRRPRTVTACRTPCGRSD